MFVFPDSRDDGSIWRAGVNRVNLTTMQAAGLGGTTGIPCLIDTSEHVCIKMQGLPYNATQIDNEFL
jgi:heterogeneous nuclear ribonucleoprotein F/H/epithelial splicing regulatory protein 1/2